MTRRHCNESAPHNISADTPTPRSHVVDEPGPTMRQAAQALLEDAATHLERHGWLQGDIWPGALYDDAAPYLEGQPCDALGALAVADRVTNAEQILPAIATGYALSDAIDALAKHIAGGDDAPTITGWNDSPDRTGAEVIAALRDTARRLARPPVSQTSPEPVATAPSTPFRNQAI